MLWFSKPKKLFFCICVAGTILLMFPNEGGDRRLPPIKVFRYDQMRYSEPPAESTGESVHSVETTARVSENKASKVLRVTLALALCHERLEQGLTLIKSLIFFTHNIHLDLRIFHDENTLAGLLHSLPILQEQAGRFAVRLKFTLYPAKYPQNPGLPAPWSQLFKPCAAQRLFLPSLLPDVDALLYLDADTLFLSDVREIWKYFRVMNETQLAGMTNHDELSGIGLYSHLNPNKLPYYGPRGVQSGVMLQNLTRMRNVGYEDSVAPIYKRFGNKIHGDQCILNVYFHYKPEQLLLLSCHFNYLVTHCDPKYRRGRCASAEKFGAHILHAADRRFEFNSNTKGTFYRNVYEAVMQADLEHLTTKALANEILRAFSQIKPFTPCWNVSFDVLQTVIKLAL